MQVQQQADEVKKRLDAVAVYGEAEGGKIKVTATGNKHIKEIVIDADFLKSADKEEVEELMAIAVNKALELAENAHQSEMQALSQNMFGGLGSLFGQ